MLAATDYVGIAALVSAIFAGLVSLVVALRQNGTVRKVDDVHAAVSMSNGSTLGQVIEQIDRNTPTPGTPPAG